MIDKSMMLFYQKRYDQLNQEILEHAKKDVDDQEQFFAKLDLLKYKQAEIAQILKRQEQEEANFAEEKMQAIFGDDPVYQKAKASWDEEFLQKFHDCRLTEDEYVEVAKKFGINLWIDDCHITSSSNNNTGKTNQ